MIVANEKGFSERSIHTAVAGEGFFLIIIFQSEIAQLPPGKWEEYRERWRTRLYPGGRLITGEVEDAFGAAPKGPRNHSWITPDQAFEKDT